MENSISDNYDDFNIMLSVVKLNGMLLEKVSNRLIQNYYIVLSAVKQNGLALKFVFDYEILYEDEYDYRYRTFLDRYIINDDHQNLIDSKSIVLAAVKNNPNALEYASERLKDNKDIVLEAIKGSAFAIKFASLRLQKDKKIIFKAIRKNIDVIYSLYLPRIYINEFIIFDKLSIDKKMNYLFDKITDGTLLSFSVAWLKVITPEYHKQLINWITCNIYDHKILFDIVFYKHLKFHHLNRLGYIKGLPNIILSFLVPSQYIQQKQKIILDDIFTELQYYS